MMVTTFQQRPCSNIWSASMVQPMLLPLFSLLFGRLVPVGAQNNDCAPGELLFGPCLPDRSCPTGPTGCPAGCHCTAGDKCCYPASATQNNWASRQNLQQQQQTGSDSSSLSTNTLNMALMLLLLRQQQQGGGGFGGLGMGGCQDRAWNCAMFATLCPIAPRVAVFCPATCGLCPVSMLSQQLLLQLLLGGQQPFGGGNNGAGNGLLDRVQGVLGQVPGIAGSLNNALGALGVPGLTVQGIAQALAQRFG